MTAESIAATALLRLTNVTAGYDRHPAVHHLSLAIESGDMLAVVGPNGAGKTTFLKLLAGELAPIEGEVSWARAEPVRVAHLAQLNRTDRSFPITVEDYVASGLWHETGAWGGLGRSQRERIRHALGSLGLLSCARRTIGTLSGGEFQRMRFAQLMLQDADLMLLDEPFAGIDATTISVLLPLMARWHGAGRTLVVVLHELDLARQWFAKALLLSRHCVAFGPTGAVLTDANWQQAAGLTAAVWQSSNWCRPDVSTAAVLPDAGPSTVATVAPPTTVGSPR